MNLHKEIKFEDEICGHLAGRDWLYEEKGAAIYDRELAIFPSDVLAWVQETQTEAERAIELLQERRTALISAAVTGKIDVREFAHNERQGASRRFPSAKQSRQTWSVPSILTRAIGT